MSVGVVSPNKTRKHLPVGKKPKLAIAKKERFTKWQKHKKCFISIHILPIQYELGLSFMSWVVT
jgi:hypothetical protein